MDLRTYLSVEGRKCGIRFNSQLCSKTDVGSTEGPSMPTPSTDRDKTASPDKKDALMLHKMHSESYISTKQSGFEGRFLSAADPQIKTLLKSAQESTLFAIDYLNRCKTIIQKLHSDCNDVTVSNANTLDRLREIEQLVQNLTRLLLPGTGEMTDGELQRADESVKKLEQGLPHLGLSGSSEKPNESQSLPGSLEKSNSGESRFSLPRGMPNPGQDQTITHDKSNLSVEPDEVPCISEVHVYLPSATPSDSELFTEEAGLTSEHPAPEVVPTQRSICDEIAAVCDSIRHSIEALENFHTTFDLEQKACLRIVQNMTKQIQNHRTSLSKVTETKLPAIYRASRKNTGASVPVVKSVVGLTGLGLLRTKLQGLASELHCYVPQESEINLSSWAENETNRAAITPHMIPPAGCFGQMDRNAGSSVTKTAHRQAKVIVAEWVGCLKIVEELYKAVRTRRELIQKQANGRFGNSRLPKARGILGRKVTTVRDVNWDMRRKLEELNEETKLCLRLEFDRSDGMRREMMRRNEEYDTIVKDLRVEVKRMKRNAVETERRRKLLEFHNTRSYGIQLGIIGTPQMECIGTSQLQSVRHNGLPEIQIVTKKAEPKIRGICSTNKSFPEIPTDKRPCRPVPEPQSVISNSDGGKSDHENPAHDEAVELQHSSNREILAVFGVAADRIKLEPYNQKQKKNAKILTKPSLVRPEHGFRSKPTLHHHSEKHGSISQSHTYNVKIH